METHTSVIAVSLVPHEQKYQFLPEVLPLLREAIGNSEALFSEEELRAGFHDGSLDMWVAVDDTGIVGCFVTELIPTAKGLDVNVPFAGFKKNFKALNDAMRELIRVCKESGYHSVRFISSDLRFGSFAKRHGFRRRFVEYVKEL